MNKIHELSELLSNQISAGEIIERPVSVVKELVENSIDARSRQIDIVLKNSGIEYIKIMDDGIGIDNDDVKLAFHQHATSKILNHDDLFKIETLGFRGEALPSIASVSDVILETKSENNLLGSKIHLKGGKIISLDSYGSRNGTEVTVSKLFYNTPVRLKYLHSLSTELSSITDYIYSISLGHPDISFTLMNNGHYILKTLGNNNINQVVSAIYGLQISRKLLNYGGEDEYFKIHGLISPPDLTRSSKHYITIIINGRVIKNNNITNAIINGYGSRLMIGRYPIAILNITLNPSLIDVNVHPTKREVRISKESLLQKIISKSIQKCLQENNLIYTFSDNLLVNNKQLIKLNNKVNLNDNTENYPDNFTPQHFTHPLKIKSNMQLYSDDMRLWDKKYHLSNKDNFKSNEDNFKLDCEYKLSDNSKNNFPNLNYIGQLHGTYLLSESENGLYILDQHAVQERIKYEYYKNEIEKRGKLQQKMLIPLILTFSASDSLKIKEGIDDFYNLGIKLEEFGRNTYIIHEHPIWIPQNKEKQIIKDLVDQYLFNNNLTIAKFRERTAIMISCKDSIKANHHLSRLQAEKLLDKLKLCDNPYNCPHGRPTIIKLGNKYIRKMFKRIQDYHEPLRKNRNLSE